MRNDHGLDVLTSTVLSSIQSLWTGQASLLVENNGSGAGYCDNFLPPSEAQATPTACDAQAFDIGINEFKL
jgi:hypothetical protein